MVSNFIKIKFSWSLYRNINIIRDSGSNSLFIISEYQLYKEEKLRSDD